MSIKASCTRRKVLATLNPHQHGSLQQYFPHHRLFLPRTSQRLPNLCCPDCGDEVSRARVTHQGEATMGMGRTWLWHARMHGSQLWDARRMHGSWLWDACMWRTRLCRILYSELSQYSINTFFYSKNSLFGAVFLKG